jgi:serine protease Do/2-alkenal reductase
MKFFPRLLCALLVLAGYSAKASTMPPALADLAASVMPAVVSIASTDPVNNATPGSDNDSDNSGDGNASAYHPAADTTQTAVPGSVLPPPKADEALGSGFVIDTKGDILTNNHVIDGATTISVTFQDGTILPATVVGRDPTADIAVLKVDAGHPLAFVTFGNSGKLRVGDWVMAIGNPYGLPGSTSAGIVSALDRNINENTFDDFIQTDAAINRGNSGGPLFNMQGEVIGVDSAIYSPSGGSVGIGFAIPSAMAAPVAQAIIATGSMTRGWLGVATQEVTPEIQRLLGLPSPSGALIGSVSPGSPSWGKLQPGDVLTALNGVPVQNPRALLIRTGEIPAGSKVPVQFWRNGSAQQTTLTLTPPPTTADNTITPIAPPTPANISLPELGLTLSATSATNNGITITAVTAHSPAAKAGIVAGNTVEQLAGKTLTNASDLQSKLKSLNLPTATLLITGDTADGTNPGPRWVSVEISPSGG